MNDTLQVDVAGWMKLKTRLHSRLAGVVRWEFARLALHELRHEFRNGR